MFTRFDLLAPGGATLANHEAPRPGAFSGGRWGTSIVGASMFQTPGAQSREIGQIDTDMRTFSSELTAAARDRGYDVHDPITEDNSTSPANLLRLAQDAAKPVPNDRIVKFFVSIWKPFARQWAAFFRENSDGAWWSNPAAEAEGMHRQLITLRETARGLGLHVLSPEPEQFSRSLLDPHHDIVDAAKDKADDIWKVLKVGAYIAIGAGVLVGGTLIYQNLRSK